MAGTWQDTYRLLLIYKDPLADRAMSGASYTAISETIALHLLAADPDRRGPDVPFERSEVEQLRVDVLRQPNLRLPLEMPEERVEPSRQRAHQSLKRKRVCVWGWWRKHWETHHELLAMLSKAARSKTKPHMLLYNPYLQRLYQGTLQGIYFEDGLTSVIVPAEWRERCPAYYRDTPHLCGAFLVLAIDRKELDAKELDRYYIDSRSMELGRGLAVIPPPHGVEDNFRGMIDGPLTRANLRTCELTMLLLRQHTQAEVVAELLRAADRTSDDELAAALRDIRWPDMLSELAKAGPGSWRVLSERPKALDEIGLKLAQASTHLTRFDFELLARATSAIGMRPILLAAPDRPMESDFSPLGKALRDWVTTADTFSAADKAAAVFACAWSAAMNRYGLEELPGSYFKALPAFEAIAYAVHYKLEGKFYRDHLNHNVRAALLAARLLDKSAALSLLGGTAPVAGFFAGLLHDLAIPLTTLASTVESIAEATSRARVSGGVGGWPEGLDRELLRRPLKYVAMLASVGDSEHPVADQQFPWTYDAVLERADMDLLLEEMVCATLREHALIGAALLMDYAVRGVSASGKDYDAALQTLLAYLEGAPSPGKEHYRELAQVIKSVALHDRRAAAEQPGTGTPRHRLPRPLDLVRFRIPAMVSVADDLQEWGRTLGRIDQVAAVDADIRADADGISASFRLSAHPGAYSGVPFSLLEYLLGKCRSMGQVRDGSAALVAMTVRLDGLQAFRLHSESGASADLARFRTQRAPVELNQDEAQPDQGPSSGPAVRQTQRPRVFTIRTGPPADEFHDVVMVRSAPSEVVRRLEDRARDGIGFSCMVLSPRDLRVEFVDGYAVVGTALSYQFGQFEPGTIPSHLVTSEPVGFLAVTVSSDNSQAGRQPRGVADDEPQSVPAGHFLDFDWRFTTPTCRAIVEFAWAEARRLRKPICYLACPSLAIWHHRLHESDSEWVLLDRGHYALEQWLEAAVPRDRYLKYEASRPLGGELRGRFGVVIVDPPWYEPHYEMFCRRAKDLLAPGGVLGLTCYPRDIDKDKYKRIQQSAIRGMIGDLRQFGSTEISYLVPEFERPGDLFRQFEHPAMQLYRPGYMDFYQVPETKRACPPEHLYKANGRLMFSRVVPLADGQHMLVNERAFNQCNLPIQVSVLRKGLKHMRSVPDEWLGWTSQNLIVRRTSVHGAWRISSVEELAALATKTEKEGPELEFHP